MACPGFAQLGNVRAGLQTWALWAPEVQLLTVVLHKWAFLDNEFFSEKKKKCRRKWDVCVQTCVHVLLTISTHCILRRVDPGSSAPFDADQRKGKVLMSEAEFWGRAELQ